MSDKNSLFNVDGISDVAIKLLEMVEKAVGWVITPRGPQKDFNDALEIYKKSIENGTEAEGIIKAVKISTARNELRKYMNIRKVLEIAINELEDSDNPNNIDFDWLSYFIEYAQNTSNEGMQYIFGRVLAEEAREANKISRSLLHALSIMSSTQADFFCSMSRYCFQDYDISELVHPIIFIATNVETYGNVGITVNQLEELKHLGLVLTDYDKEYIFTENPKRLRYGNKLITIFGDKENDNKIKTGNVMFTNDGIVLYNMLRNEYKNYNAHRLDFIIVKFKLRNCEIIIQ